jgi:hypothetical protein
MYMQYNGGGVGHYQVPINDIHSPVEQTNASSIGKVQALETKLDNTDQQAISGTLDFEAAGACEEHEGWDVELDAGGGSGVQLIKEVGMHHQGDELRLGNNTHMIGKC